MTYNYSDNVQRGILYFCKNERDFYLQINNLVKPEYFEFPVHSDILKVIINYFEKYNKLPNNDFIIEDLKTLDKRSNPIDDYIDELEQIDDLAETDYISNKNYFLDLAENYAKKQALKSAIIKSLEHIKEDNGNYGIVEHLVKEALLINRNINVGQSYFDDLNDRYDRIFNVNKEYRFPTVFDGLNTNLDGGNCAKELAMVVSPPGVGKSLYLVNQAYTTLMQDKKVLYISLEMSEDKISARFDSVISRIPAKELKNPENKDDLKSRLEAFKQVYPNSQLIIKEFPTGLANVNTIRTLLHNLKDKHEFTPDLIIVDYLELLRPTRIIDAEYMAQQRIAEELRGLAVEHNVLVWTATQPNREGSKVEIITDSHLGDSYGKIRVADFAISINQSREEYDDGKARVYVMKARDSKQKYIIGIRINYTNLVMGDAPIIIKDLTVDNFVPKVEHLLSTVTGDQGELQ